MEDCFLIVNDIRTIHSRENFVPLLDTAIRDNRLLIANAEKIKSLISATPDVLSGRNLTDSKDNMLQNLENVKSYVSYQKAQDPRGAYHKDIIYLFETADASTFMHETAHWFKGELKKFGSEKSALMLKKVDLGG